MTWDKIQKGVFITICRWYVYILEKPENQLNNYEHEVPS